MSPNIIYLYKILQNELENDKIIYGTLNIIIFIVGVRYGTRTISTVCRV